MPLFLILSKLWGRSVSGAFFLRVEKEASASALRLRKGNKGSCNDFTERMPSGFFSGKYVLAVRCNTDLLECIGDTFGNKMFRFRIMVRNKIKNRSLCTQGGACTSQTGEKRLLKKLLPRQEKIFVRDAALCKKSDKRFRNSNSKIAQQVFWLGQLLINGMPASCSALYFLLQSGKKYPSMT